MLDFSYLSDKRGDKPFLQLSDADVARVHDAFARLREKTGVYIDPYGRTRIYPEHQKILITLLSKDADGSVHLFIDFLKVASEADEVLLADGD